VIYHGTNQVGFVELTVAIATATDPLEIVNAFFRYPPGVDGFPFNPYWEKRVCAMAELIAAGNRKPKSRRKAKKR
jgi:hypothetical protein